MKAFMKYDDYIRKKTHIYFPEDRDDALHILLQHHDTRYPDKAYELLSKEDLILVCKFLQERVWEYQDDFACGVDPTTLIKDLEFSVRTRQALENYYSVRFEHITAGLLRDTPDRDLLKSKIIGMRVLREIRDLVGG